MEDSETKCCPNCKREIPCVNFTIHSVHCARNIRICPVCKEPVPQHELQEHHDKLHKLYGAHELLNSSYHNAIPIGAVPCKKCGESVCGTDLEDHIRDSCAHTVKTCRFCELELPRRELPAHESYCGVRTEQCPECREWVMIKYRQLHLDSNHGFIRLDDDPAPVPKSNILRAATNNINVPSTSNGVRAGASHYRPNGYVRNINEKPTTEIRYFDNAGGSGSSSNGISPSNDWRTSQTNGVKAKRTNDQPQINTNVPAANKVDKNLGLSRGAVKKRPAPKPPRVPPTADSVRDMPYYSALERQQREERERNEQTAYNLSVGLPPVLSAAAKLEKLRRLDALQNPDVEPDFRAQNRLQRTPELVPFGRTVGTLTPPEDIESRRQEFKDLKPMSPQEFMERFSELQLRNDGEADRKKSADRFSEIKSSLRELRRGLNEVTAPYNSNSNANSSNNNNEQPPGALAEERLPCEFCDALVPAADLVQHQTGCRPDLAQLLPRPAAADVAGVVGVAGAGGAVGAAAALEEPSPPRLAYPEPVIPCEFCTESLPVYLISEHQERCGREANLLYPD